MVDRGLPTSILGRTGFAVTRLGYGTLELRSASDLADGLLHAVLDGGINFIDTAPDYGESEEAIGRAISSRRDEYFLATKCGCVVGDVVPPGAVANPGGTLFHLFTAKHIIAGVEASLRRLKTDYLDLVQFHGSPSFAELERDGAIDALAQLRARGIVRFIGASTKMPELPAFIASRAFDVLQMPYSAFQREHEALITEAARAGAGTVIRGGLARGAASDDKQWRVTVFGLLGDDPREIWEESGLDELLDGASRIEFILRFTISHPDLHTAIAGTSKIDHLQQNVAALRKGPLPDDVYVEAKRRLSRVVGAR